MEIFSKCVYKYLNKKIPPPSSFLHAFASPTLTIFVFSLLRHCSSNSGIAAADFQRRGSPKTEPSLLFDYLSLFSVLLQLLRRSFHFRRTNGGRQRENGKVPSFLEPLEIYFLYCWFLIFSPPFLVSFSGYHCYGIFRRVFRRRRANFGTCNLGFNFIGEFSPQTSLLFVISGEIWVKSENGVWVLG